MLDAAEEAPPSDGVHVVSFRSATHPAWEWRSTGKLLGSGAFALVLEAVAQRRSCTAEAPVRPLRPPPFTDALCAIKVYTARAAASFELERRALALLKLHRGDPDGDGSTPRREGARHVVTMLHVVDAPRAGMVLELAECGDMVDFLCKLPNRRVDDHELASSYCRQLLLAVAHLHDAGVAHCDIKLDNLLLFDGGTTLKLADLGMALLVDVGAHGDWSRADLTGSQSYRAPEVSAVPLRPYDARHADLWSVGICAYSISLGHFPVQSTKVGESLAFERIRKACADETLPFMRGVELVYGTRLDISIAPRALRDLLDALLVIAEPSRRRTAAEALAMDWCANHN